VATCIRVRPFPLQEGARGRKMPGLWLLEQALPASLLLNGLQAIKGF
jgi:hypothetical protein